MKNILIFLAIIISSVFAQTQPLIVASAKGFYMADSSVFSDAGTTPAVNNDPVYQWNNLRGVAANLANTTLAQRPTFISNAQNGKATLRFDGSADNYAIAGNFFTDNNEFTVIAVLAARDAGGLGLAVSYTKSTATTARIYIGNNGTDIYGRAGGDASTDIETSTATYSKFYIHALQGTGGTVTSWVNNESGESEAFVNNTDATAWAIGAYWNGTTLTAFFEGDVSAVILFNSAITETERKQVMDWLAYDYYGIDGYTLQIERPAVSVKKKGFSSYGGGGKY